MTQGYARITGRVVGPEGLGRMGTLEFTPLPRYEGVLEDDSHALIAHYAVGRFREDGVLVGFDGTPGLNVAAPRSLPDGEYNYRVCINIPGGHGPDPLCCSPRYRRNYYRHHRAVRRHPH